jgi:hypothetical protein
MYKATWGGVSLLNPVQVATENGKVVTYEAKLNSGTEFSPDGLLLASTQQDGHQFKLHLDEVTSSRTVTVVPGVRFGMWSVDGRYLMTAGARLKGEKSEVRKWECYQLWEVACPVPVYQAKEPINRLLFRADGKQLAVNDTIWEVIPGGSRPVLRPTRIEAPKKALTFVREEVWATRLPERFGGKLEREDMDIDTVLGTTSLIGCSCPLGGQNLLSIPVNFAAGLPASWQRPLLFQIGPPGRSVVLPLPGNRDWLAEVLKRDQESRANPRKFHPYQGAREKITRIYRYSPGYHAEQVAFSPDGKTVVVMVGFGTLGEMTDENGTRLATSHGGGNAWVLESWNLDTGQRRSLTNSRMEFCHDLAFHPDSRRLATVGTAGVQVWDVMKGTAIRALSPERYDQLSWRQDGKSLLVVEKNSKAAIFETEGGKIREWPAPAREWNAFTLDPNGQSVITGGEDRMIHIRDVRSGKELARWQAHEAPIRVLTFSPDGKFLVSGALDGTIKLWDLAFIRKELAALGLDW